jgi:creatinine amidohydrolase
MALRTHLMVEMTWPEVQEYLADHDTILWPVGSTEQHGLHGGLGSDTITALELARRVAPRVNALIAPVLQYGVSGAHMHFPGTLAVSRATFAAMVDEVLASMLQHGFRKIFVLSGHGGNNGVLGEAAGRLRHQHDAFCAVVPIFAMLKAITPPTMWQSHVLGPGDGHAGELETSLVLAARPAAVDLPAARREEPHQLVLPNEEMTMHYPVGLTFEGWTALSSLSTEEYSPDTGCLGDPMCATVEKGERAFALAADTITRFVEAVRLGMAVSPRTRENHARA